MSTNFYKIDPLLAKEKCRVIIWSEGTEPNHVYPSGIHGCLSEFLNRQTRIVAKAVHLDGTNQGLNETLLKPTDVLIWFGHQRHLEVQDALVAQIVQRVSQGMGFIALHSSHFSKPFQQLLNTRAAWQSYIEEGGPERICVVDEKHPIASHVQNFELPESEMYTEPFEVPTPMDVVFEGTWKNGETSREVMTWKKALGKIVYLRMGHESYPIYTHPSVQQIILNAILWCHGGAQ